jgi:hypothetical protein
MSVERDLVICDHAALVNERYAFRRGGRSAAAETVDLIPLTLVHHGYHVPYVS